MKTKSISGGRTAWLFSALLAVTLAAGLAAPRPAQAVEVGIGVGIGGPPVGDPYWYWHRHFLGPRPYWYGAAWYHPYWYWGAFPFYAGFPVGYVNTWPDAVRIYHRDAYSAALAGPIGEGFVWSDGHDRGSVTAVREGHSGAMYCREFRQEVSIRGGAPQVAMSAACRDPGGMWHPAADNP